MLNAQLDVSITERGRKSPRYELAFDQKGQLTFQEFLGLTRATLITVAQEVLKEELLKGFDKGHIVRVDNRLGKPIEAVNPLGQIEFLARVQIKEILLFAYEAILQRSRVDTGLYKSVNLVTFRGKVIADNLSTLERWIDANGSDVKDSDRFRFVNIAPYAAKLERYGITAQRSRPIFVDSREKRRAARGVKVLKPNGTYVLAHRAIKSKFKNNSNIRFEFLPGSYLGNVPALNNPKTGKPMRTSFHPKGKFNSGPYLYPTIVIGVNEAGILQ